MRTCNVCLLCKSEEEFSIAYGNYRRLNCKSCVNAATRSRNSKNIDAVRKRNAESYLRNRQKRIQYQKDYAAENEEFLRNRRAELRKLWTPEQIEGERARKRKHKKTPRIRLKENLRSRIHVALMTNQKAGRTLDLLGCSIPEWRDFLTSMFRPGMSWDNYGKVWEIDHVKPCAKFDLSLESEQKACFNWSNTQPLTIFENRRKADR